MTKSSVPNHLIQTIMSDIQEFPHCRPLIRGDVSFSGSFQSYDSCVEFAKKQEYNVIVNENDSNQYYLGRIVKVLDHGDLKFALGSADGRDCNCLYTGRVKHHIAKDEARGLCVSKHALLDEVDSRFAPTTDGERDFNYTAWRIDSYKLVNIQ